jgi:PAS domain S-box-containing protein
MAAGSSDDSMDTSAGPVLATATSLLAGAHADALLTAVRNQFIVSITDAAGTIVEANEAFCAISGYGRAELLGATHRIVNSGHHDQAFYTELWRQVLAGRAWRGEICNRAKDGRLYWVDSTISPLPGADGRPERFVCIASDITQRKQQEQAARESEERRFNRLYECTPAMLHSFDAEGRLISVSDVWLETLGYRREEVLGRRSWDFMTPESRDNSVNRLLPEFFRTGRVDNVEAQMVCKDGRVIDVLGSAILERDAANRPLRSRSVMFDITPRKQAQRELAASEARFKTMVDDHSDLVAVIDIDGVVAYANRSLAQLLGQTVPALIGTSVYRHLPPAEAEAARQRVAMVCATRQVLPHETMMPATGGAQRWISWIMTPLFNDEGRVTAIHSVGRDITERRRIESELEKANERFAIAADAAGIGFWHLDLPTGVLTWDDWMYRIHWRNRADGEDPYEIWRQSAHPDDRIGIDQVVREASQGVLPGYTREYRIIWPTGQVRHIRTAATVKHGPDGSPSELLGVHFDITEQKRNLNDLLAANRRFAIAADAAGMGFWEWNIATNVVTWDDWMYRLYDLPRSEPLSPMQLWQTMLHPDDKPGAEALLADILQGNCQTYVMEFRIMLRDGRIRHLGVFGSLLRDADGLAIQMYGVNFDVTDRKRAEDALRLANQRFAIAADSAGIGFWDWDIRANTLSWDDWMFRLYGRERSQGLQPYEIWAGNLHPDDRLRAEQESRAAIDGTAESFNTEFRIIRPDGQVRDIIAAASVLRDRDGAATHMFGVNYDITERKRIERELRRANQHFAIAADAAGIGFWHWDMLTNTLTWDDWMFRLYGRSGADGKAAYDVWASSLHPDDRARAEEEGLDAREGKRPYNTEFRVVHPDGQIRHLKAAASVTRDAHGNAIQIYGVNFDITDRKLAELRLSRLVSELKRSNGELEQFAYVASHDLKSPLRGIHQLATWIGDDLRDTLHEDTRQNLVLMQSRIDRLDRLLDDLLAYARAGRAEGEIVPVDTRALVNDIFDLLATRKAIRLEVQADLPVLHTRKAPLELVFRNLIGNAIKHHDKPQGRITIGARPIDGSYEFSVTDDGPGIAPEHQQRVFGMFQTLRSRDDVEGSGIGLAIIKKTVESLHGTVSLESDGEHGSTFRFTWPADMAAVLSERNAATA